MIERKKSLADLRDEMNISSTTAIHALKELGKSNLTCQDKNRDYYLTNTGRIVALKLLDFINAAQVLQKHERFWLEHDLSGIPEYMMERIGWLKDSKIIQVSQLDIIKTHSSYISYIKTAKWVKGVYPIYSSDYAIVFKELIERNINICLILSEAVLNKLIEAAGLDYLRNATSRYNLEILIANEKLEVAFTVTDSFLSLGLFTKNGVYDITHDLVAADERAVHWGHELFEYYRDRTKRYEL
ncbi:MAG TPA: transcriptional regulator FilR1 domain-containing protein [Candidatus Methanoperedens sp.]